MILVRHLLAYSLRILALLAVMCPVLAAQNRAYEGSNVVDVRFEPAKQPLQAGELSAAVELKTGEPLRMSQVRASIGKLYATGRYSDIQVDARPENGGVAISFITKPRWFVGDVAITGNIPNPPTAGQLENAAALNLGAAYSEFSLKEALAGQQQILESNGVYSAKITPSLDYDTSAAFQQLNFSFEVEAGRRASFGPPALTGDLKVDPKKIEDAMGLRRWIVGNWKPVTQSRVRQALEGVRRLYQKESRLEAKISLQSMNYDPQTNVATPTLRIDAGPRTQFNTIGFNLSQKKLRQYVPVFEENAVDTDLLVEGARNLQDYLQSQGYFEAAVQFKQQRVVNDKSNIDFLINTGSRHKLVHIGVNGNKYFTAESIRERMFLRIANFLQFPRGRYSENLVQHDEESISNLYQSNGFRDVRVTHRSQDDYNGKKGEMAIFIDVEEGPQYFIQDLQVTGVQTLNREGLLSGLSSIPGQPFSEFNVAIDRDAILAQYFEKGFPNAAFEWSSSPADEPNRVNLRYAIVEGNEQVVREVVATGLRTTRPGLVKRNFGFGPGDPLSPTAITETQRRLYGLGIFSRVDAAIQNPDGDTGSKYVVYNLDEARRYSVAAGIGAFMGKIGGGCSTCFDNPTGVIGFSPRVSIDLTRSNLWGAAHSLSLRTRASTLTQRAILNYSWPRFGNHENLNVSVTGMYEKSRDVRTFNSRRQEASVQLSERVSKATVVFYRFSYRRVSVSDLKVTQFLLAQLSQPVRVGMPSLNVVQDRRDDPVDPHRGVYNTFDIGLADRIFGSQRNFLRFLGRNSSYHQISRRVVFARSTEFGNIYAFRYGSSLTAVPLAERFIGGGGTAHRGFPENEAGPRDLSTGYPLGGTAILFNQLEMRVPLIGENIGAVLFHDAGNIYSSISNISFRTTQRGLQDFDYMVHAAGLGLRYRTPIGPVRADVAYTVNSPNFFGFRGTQQDLINAGTTPCSPPPGVPNRCVVRNAGHFQFFVSIGQTF
jgi:outer membrane protein insertion porin family